MIPETFDALATVNELNRLGVKDYKIQLVCRLTGGYVAQIKCGNIVNPRYEICAKLYNLLEEERVSRGTLHSHNEVVAADINSE